MMSLRLAHHPRIAKLIIAISTCCVFLLFRLPLYRGFSYGDDALLVRDALHPPGPSSLVHQFLTVGGGKWRPVSTPILLSMARLYKYDLVPFQVLSMLMLLAIGFLIGVLVWRSTSNLPSGIFCAALSVSSPFTWLFQSWMYGVMEALALLLTTMSLFLFVHMIKDHRISARRFNMAAFTLFLATLTHERYLIVVFALWMLFVWQPISGSRLNKLSRTLILIPLFHVVTKGILLGISPIASGGETTNKLGLNFSFLTNFFKGLTGVFGGLSGSGYYYSEGTFADAANSKSVNGLLPLTVAITILIGILVSIFLKSRAASLGKSRRAKLTLSPELILCWVGLSLLVPGALVPERFEGRWILGPQVFLIARLTVLFSKLVLNRSMRYALALFFSGAMLLTNLTYKKHSDQYFVMRAQVDNSLSQLNALRTREPWVVIVHQKDPIAPTSWQFAYGSVFSQLRNPPYKFGFSSNPNCPVFRKKMTCYIIEIDGIVPTTRVYESE